MPDLTSPWGDFTRATTVLTTGDELVHDWYVASGEPELMLRTPDRDVALLLLPRLSPFFADRAGWCRRATDAIVTRFSSEEPTVEELEEVARDLSLATVEVDADGSVVLHFSDSCGEHFPEGYWPAVRFDREDAVSGVTVEV